MDAAVAALYGALIASVTGVVVAFLTHWFNLRQNKASLDSRLAEVALNTRFNAYSDLMAATNTMTVAVAELAFATADLVRRINDYPPSYLEFEAPEELATCRLFQIEPDFSRELDRRVVSSRLRRRLDFFTDNDIEVYGEINFDESTSNFEHEDEVYLAEKLEETVVVETPGRKWTIVNDLLSYMYCIRRKDQHLLVFYEPTTFVEGSRPMPQWIDTELAAQLRNAARAFAEVYFRNCMYLPVEIDDSAFEFYETVVTLFLAMPPSVTVATAARMVFECGDYAKYGDNMVYEMRRQFESTAKTAK